MCPLLVSEGVWGEDVRGSPAVVTSLGHPELTVTVETMRGHVIGHPPRDLHTHTHRQWQHQVTPVNTEELIVGRTRVAVS